jgi:hypothetical protein
MSERKGGTITSSSDQIAGTPRSNRNHRFFRSGQVGVNVTDCGHRAKGEMSASKIEERWCHHVFVRSDSWVRRVRTETIVSSDLDRLG